MVSVQKLFKYIRLDWKHKYRVDQNDCLFIVVLANIHPYVFCGCLIHNSVNQINCKSHRKLVTAPYLIKRNGEKGVLHVNR